MLKPERQKASRRLAELRAFYLELLAEGLGQDAPSAKDVIEVDEFIEKEVVDACFQLYARVELCKALGVEKWFRAEVTGEWPDKPPEEGEEWKEGTS